MLMGIILHAALPYFSRLADFEYVWPADDDQSVFLAVVFDFIHVWRMPTFFLLAGFFAHLVLARRPDAMFVRDRLKRIALPLALFGAIMAVIIPPIWLYGWYGTTTLDTFTDSLLERRDLDSSGELVAHLWFLYYLLIMYAALITCRQIAGLMKQCSAPSLHSLAPIGRVMANAVYSRAPLLLALAAMLLLIVRGGDESKPVWPLNVPDILYGALFFLYGYGLYAKRELIDSLLETKTLAALWAAAIIAYFAHLALFGALDEMSSSGVDAGSIELLELADVVAYGASAALFSLGFVGLFERILRSPRPWVRWLADSSYWIYIMHLPVVTFLTFYLAHLDRQGWLKYLTGFGWNAEMKFLVACALTGLMGLVTYRYLIRYTPIGTMLNGKRVAD